jgi:Protein of unknown function (DUF3309)
VKILRLGYVSAQSDSLGERTIAATIPAFTALSCGGVADGNTRRSEMTLGTILLIVVVLALLGALPSWPHSRSWGYAPSGVIGLVAVVLVVMLAAGRL